MNTTSNLLHFLFGIASLLVIFLVLLVTPTGLQVSVQVAGYFMPGQLSVGQVQGTLFTQIKAQDIHYQSPGQTLSIDQLVLQWRPKYLLQKTLYLEKLHVDELTISQHAHENNGTSGEFSLPALDWRLVAKDVQLTTGDNTLQVQGQYTDNWRLKWSINAPTLSQIFTDMQGQAQGQGVLQGPVINGQSQLTVSNFAWQQTQFAQLQLTGAINASRGSQWQLQINDWQQNDQMIEQANLHINGDLSAHTLDLALTQAQVDARLQLQGSIDDNTWQGQISQASLTFLQQNWQLAEPSGLTASAQNVSLDDFILQHRNAKVQLALDWQAAGDLQAQIGLRDFPLARLRPWLPRDLSVQSGDITANFTFTHKNDDTQLTGQLQLAQGQLSMPEYNTTLSDINLAVSPINLQKLRIEGSAQMGDGLLNVTGDTGFAQGVPFLNLHFQGEDLLLTDTEEAYVLASPAIDLQLQGRRIDITGAVVFPQAKLTPYRFNQYIAPSPDIIIVNQPQPETSPWQIYSRVTLQLGDNIDFSAGNLSTQINGQLTLNQQPDTPLRASGELNLYNGRYAAYGQALNISRGQITFLNSPIDNPSLNILAEREITVASQTTDRLLFADTGQANQLSGYTGRTGRVGVSITGTVDDTDIQLFSEPAMSDEDQLSYLLAGVPSDQLSAAQGQFIFATINEASRTLGIQDDESSVIDNITKALNVQFQFSSETRVDSETGDLISDPSVVVGTDIARNLTISYSIGLLDPFNIFRVRYRLSRHWSIQSETTSQGDTGGDIIYQIESNRLF